MNYNMISDRDCQCRSRIERPQRHLSGRVARYPHPPPSVQRYPKPKNTEGSGAAALCVLLVGMG